MPDPTVRLLRDLIAIDSVNPGLVRGSAGEGQIADAIALAMRKIGLDVELEEVAAGRSNVVGVLEGKSPGRSLMLCGHIDTVGVEGMHAPFDPVERDGRVYGRGSQDMKGGIAAMIGAAQAIADNGGLASGRLILAAVIDEEYKSAGADALVKKWKADAAVVTEPTDLVVSIGHKGFAWVEVKTGGRAAHGSRPSDGRDAILRMGRVLSRLERLDHDLRHREPHPLLGTGSLHASLISGGRELSTYPDNCSLMMERRTISTEPETIALQEVEKILAELKEEDPEFEASAQLLFSRPAYEIPHDHELTVATEQAVAETGLTSRYGGMTFWTDAAILGQAGIPSLVFGPGGAGLHGPEEYVRVDEVLSCRNALAELARRFCAPAV